MQIKYFLSILTATSIVLASPVIHSSKSESSSEVSTSSSSESSSTPTTTLESFGLVAHHSGSIVHNKSITIAAEYVFAFNVGGNGAVIDFRLDDTELLVSGARVWIYSAVESVGNEGTSDSETTTFTIDDGRLLHDGSDSFYACPTKDGGYDLYAASCKRGLPIQLKVV